MDSSQLAVLAATGWACRLVSLLLRASQSLRSLPQLTASSAFSFSDLKNSQMKVF